jgi:hypothetical protein
MDIEKKLKEALIKDFNALYVKGFTFDWQAQRLIRSTEINVMQLPNTLKLLTTPKEKATVLKVGDKVRTIKAGNWMDCQSGANGVIKEIDKEFEWECADWKGHYLVQFKGGKTNGYPPCNLKKLA